MTGRVLWALAVVAGIAGFFLLYPRHDSMPVVWKAEMSRAEVIDAAGRQAQKYGVDVARWPISVDVSTDAQLAEALRVSGPQAIPRRFTPLQYSVVAVSPSGDQTVRIRLSNEGELLDFQRSTRQVDSTAEAGAAQGASDVAFKELAAFTGDAAAQFRPVSDGTRVQRGTLYAWELPAKSGIDSVMRFETTLAGSAVVQSTLTLVLNDQRSRDYALSLRNQSLRSVLTIFVLGFITVLAALIVFFARMARRMDHLQMSLRLLPIAVVPAIAEVLSGSAVDSIRVSAADGDVSLVTAAVLWGLLQAVTAIAFSLLIGAGLAALDQSQAHRWVSLKLLVTGRALTKPVGRDGVTGLTGGAALAVCYYLPAAMGLTSAPARVIDADFLVSAHPVVSSLGALWSWDSIGLFAFLLPWALSLRRRVLASALAVGAGVIFAAAIQRVYAGAPLANVAFGMLWVAGLTWIYSRGGLLAVLVAPLAVGVAAKGAYFQSLSDSGMHANTLPLAGAFVVAVAACSLVARFGRDANVDEEAQGMIPADHHLTRSEREALNAEFSVASRAQQGMLPAEMPALPGYSVHAVCVPAKEVGGDLYDCFPSSDGSWMFCVADVSGKGVPAALYMTLTKGLLSAASTYRESPASIAIAINRHLHVACRRKTFVTMSLAELNPESGAVSHIRAGHNPPLLIRSRTRSAEFLQPKGLGLGISRTNIFDGTLETQTVELAPGDVLVLYSDGLPEMMNRHREQYGEDRLLQVAVANAHLDARGIVDRILDDVSAFRGAAEQHDDLTILALCRDPASPADTVA